MGHPEQPLFTLQKHSEWNVLKVSDFKCPLDFLKDQEGRKNGEEKKDARRKENSIKERTSQ